MRMVASLLTILVLIFGSAGPGNAIGPTGSSGRAPIEPHVIPAPTIVLVCLSDGSVVVRVAISGVVVRVGEVGDARKRYYDPAIGRFITQDPAQAGMNWQNYCGGDPVNRADPSGLDWVAFDGNDAYYYHEQDSWRPGRQSSGRTKIGTRGQGDLIQLDADFQHDGRRMVEIGLLNEYAAGSFSGDMSGGFGQAAAQLNIRTAQSGALPFSGGIYREDARAAQAAAVAAELSNPAVARMGMEIYNQIQDTTKVIGGRTMGIDSQFLDLRSGMAASAQQAVDEDRVASFVTKRVALEVALVAAPKVLQTGSGYVQGLRVAAAETAAIERAAAAEALAALNPANAQLVLRPAAETVRRAVQTATLTDDAIIGLNRNMPDVVLQMLTNRAVAQLGANPALAANVLKPLEYAAGQRAIWLGNMQFGNAVERMVAQEVRRFPALRGVLDYAGGAGRPDFYGRGLWQGATFDITTFLQIPTKFPGGLPKYPDLTVIPYLRPGSVVPFP